MSDLTQSNVFPHGTIQHYAPLQTISYSHYNTLYTNVTTITTYVTNTVKYEYYDIRILHIVTYGPRLIVHLSIILVNALPPLASHDELR